MLTEIENEANDLLQGASYAVDHNNALLKLKSLPEVSYALEKILQMHGQCPHKLTLPHLKVMGFSVWSPSNTDED